MAYSQGLARSGDWEPSQQDRPEQDASLPAQIMDAVRLYNTIPVEDDALCAEAVRLAW